ncbi:carboxymuconolactone decarboxylase family protein [Humisphaera borealis]|uniref:Carboxymuconolactone decarboxylase family protein n=1 Tax=Humisphaera borealis TaxID=2807512 RepID=A0A7M2WZ25_9BACT|nr:carboxymuconolactone decarboxylase family protein [Humisphaera borealis]QOV90689.1 carboxymuconolactone decarboxylase family protein [Humisphaera borealis]
MSRLPIQDLQSTTGPNKQIYDALQKMLGTVPNMARVMGNSPAVLQAWAQFNGTLGSAKLPAKTREQIALLTAENNACDYCLSAHTAIGKLVGLKQDEIDAARDGLSGDARTSASLAFAQAVIDSKGGVSDDDFAAAKEAGLSDAELAEVVAAVALNVFTNYFNRAFGVDVDFPAVHARKAALAV